MPKAEAKIDLAFWALASACLIVGVGMGVYMGATRNFALAPAHGHLNLLGWVSLALFGTAYRLYPTLAGTRLATTHFALSGSSAVLFPLGIYIELTHANPVIVAIGALLWFAGAVLFLLLTARLLLRPSPSARSAAGG